MLPAQTDSDAPREAAIGLADELLRAGDPLARDELQEELGLREYLI